MKIKEMWISQPKNRFGQHTLGGILGVAALALLLTGGGVALGFTMGWPMKGVSVLLCLGVTALGVALAVGLGRQSVKDATVFFLMEGDRLFVLDARQLVGFGSDALSHAAAMVKVQGILRELAQKPYLPARAEEILKVERIRENPTHYALICQVRRPQGQVVRRTCFVVCGLEGQEQLLLQLERRLQWPGSPELEENRKPLCLCLSILACCGFAALCVVSHPAVGLLPQSVYFPFLGATFVALCCAVWFAVRYRRGE